MFPPYRPGSAHYDHYKGYGMPPHRRRTEMGQHQYQCSLESKENKGKQPTIRISEGKETIPEESLFQAQLSPGSNRPGHSLRVPSNISNQSAQNVHGPFEGTFTPKDCTIEWKNIVSARREFFGPEDENSIALRISESFCRQDGDTPSIKWIHIKTDNMTLETFKDTVAHIRGIQEHGTLGMVLDLMRAVKDKEKSYIFGRYLVPSSTLMTGHGDPKKNIKNQHAIFTAYPYMVLEEHHKPSSKNLKSSNIHPPRTLSQTRYRLESTEKRDQKQVIRKVLRTDPPTKKVLVVHQLWVLLVNNDTLVTCANVSQAELCGTRIKSEPAPKYEGGKIRLRDPHGTYHVFKVEHCSTWFQFQSVIKALGLDEYEQEGALETADGRFITDANWAQILCEADQKVLEIRARQPAKHENGRHRLMTTPSTRTLRAQRRQNSIPLPSLRLDKFDKFQIEPLVLHNLPKFVPPDNTFTGRTPRSQHGNPFERGIRKGGMLESPGPNSLYVLQESGLSNPLGYIDEYDGAGDRDRELREYEDDLEDDKIYYDADSDYRKVKAGTRHTPDGNNRSGNGSGSWPSSSTTGQSLETAAVLGTDTDGLPLRASKGRNSEEELSEPCKPKVPAILTWPTKKGSGFHLTVSGFDTTVAENILDYTHSLFIRTETDGLMPYEIAANKTYQKMNAKTVTDYQSTLEGLKGYVEEHQKPPAPDGDKTMVDLGDTKKELRFTDEAPARRDKSVPETPEAKMADKELRFAKEKVKVLNHAFKVFSLFAPTNFKSETHGKFWAALDIIARLYYTDARLELVGKFARELKEQVRLVDKIENGVTAGDSTVPIHYLMPKDLVEAFRDFLVLTVLTAYTLENLCSKDTIKLEKIYDAVSQTSDSSMHVTAPNSPTFEQVHSNEEEQHRLSRFHFRRISAGTTSQAVRATPPPEAPEEDKAATVLSSYSQYIQQLAAITLGHMEKGMLQLILMVHRDYTPEATYGPVTTRGLAAALFEQVDMMCKVPEFEDIIDMYNAYASSLLEVQEHPRKRLLHDINYFREELSHVKAFYSEQHTVDSMFLTNLLDCCAEEEAENDQQEENNELARVRQTVEKMVVYNADNQEELAEIIDHAEDLRKQTIELVDFKNEDQGKAIFVFTIVTIVFLPLSFVTSYFGMNTRDIRDMEHEQSTFWTVALPVALVTLFVSCFVAFWGESFKEMLLHRKAEKRKITEAKLEKARRESIWDSWSKGSGGSVG